MVRVRVRVKVRVRVRVRVMVRDWVWVRVGVSVRVRVRVMVRVTSGRGSNATFRGGVGGLDWSPRPERKAGGGEYGCGYWARAGVWSLFAY